MINLLMMVLSLAAVQTPAISTAAVPVTTCVWPNRCKAPVVAQFKPCVWPNRCASEPAVLAQFKPCVWPNRCSSRQDSPFAFAS